MERTCKKCGETKPIEKFVKSKTTKSGRRAICKKCAYVIYNSKWQKENREKRNDYANLRKEFYRRNYKKYRLLNKISINNKNKIQRDDYINNLKLPYIMIGAMRYYNLTRETLYGNPELIEYYKQQLKLKRLLKQKRNENNYRLEK